MAMPARAYDALYDTTYSVSGARDHYRQQTVSGGFQVAKAPNYPYMFSELPHFPASSYRFKNSDKVPGFVDRTFHASTASPAELSSKSQPDQINGPHRYKYFRRPMLAAPDAIIIKQAPPLPVAPPPPVIEEPKSKTIGTQSDYRENEAQTLPWEPDVTLPATLTEKQKHLAAKHHCDAPELLKLKDLKFGDGLPPGLQEVRRIEKMREKRAFEATLPAIDDLERLPLRQKMIEEWEGREWEEREEEILSVQDERLVLLEQALLAREEEYDEGTARRVEGRKAHLLQDGSTRFAAVQANRIKTMRRLIEARKYVEKPRKLHKLTIVEKYANFGSNLYAPVQRDGRFSDTRTIETEGFQPATLQGLHELESYIPARKLEPKIAVPTKPVKLDYKQRQDAAVQRDLKAINDLLDNAKLSKGGRGIGDCWPAPLAGITGTARIGTVKRASVRPAERPDTPVLAAAATPATSRDAAAVLIQRLLRGRAGQNSMFDGKTRRHALIEELRTEELGLASTSRPEDADDSSAVELDALVGHLLSGLLSALAEKDPSLRADKMQRALTPASVQQSPRPQAPAEARTPSPDHRERAALAAERRAAAAASSAPPKEDAAPAPEVVKQAPAGEQAPYAEGEAHGDPIEDTAGHSLHVEEPTATAAEHELPEHTAPQEAAEGSSGAAEDETGTADESAAVEDAVPDAVVADADDALAAPEPEETSEEGASEHHKVLVPAPPEGRPPYGGRRPGSAVRGSRPSSATVPLAASADDEAAASMLLPPAAEEEHSAADEDAAEKEALMPGTPSEPPVAEAAEEQGPEVPGLKLGPHQAPAPDPGPDEPEAVPAGEPPAADELPDATEEAAAELGDASELPAASAAEEEEEEKPPAEEERPEEAGEGRPPAEEEERPPSAEEAGGVPSPRGAVDADPNAPMGEADGAGGAADEGQADEIAAEDPAAVAPSSQDAPDTAGPEASLAPSAGELHFEPSLGDGLEEPGAAAGADDEGTSPLVAEGQEVATEAVMAEDEPAE